MPEALFLWDSSNSEDYRWDWGVRGRSRTLIFLSVSQIGEVNSRQVAQQVEKEIGITLRRSVTAVPRPSVDFRDGGILKRSWGFSPALPAAEEGAAEVQLLLLALLQLSILARRGMTSLSSSIYDKKEDCDPLTKHFLGARFCAKWWGDFVFFLIHLLLGYVCYDRNVTSSS